MTKESPTLLQIDNATARLLTTARGLTQTDLAASTLCPGWTRGHVLTHIARNADALTNLLTWARTGVVTPAYPSPEAREAGIQDGASRPLHEILADLSTSSQAFHQAAEAVPESAWQNPVSVLDSQEFPAAEILTRRLLEVVLHHTDLRTDYDHTDWPPALATMTLPAHLHAQRESRRRSPAVTHLSWGRIDVENLGTGKDFKLYPGGGHEWDWSETGTRHSPGIQVDDVRELVTKGSTVIVLSRGMQQRLEVTPEALAYLKSEGLEVHVAETTAAVDLYNHLAKTEHPGALLHSTC
ncbi:MTH938/NDUFAF3 family protein [Spirillospora sp. CA-294931]|uniref:MTH938/NDUFAF3 family protein n=1 Tax=Spirillospora sp. CA-294931 TaxID=3240042 RepID=UPI003D8AA629